MITASTLTRTFSLGAAAIALTVLLASCTQKQQQATLPIGPQTLTGSLSPVELSLTRRGTHILRQNGKDIYYVESSTVNLRAYEGMDVTITGTLEKNSDTTALPVLVATAAALIQEPSHAWTVPVLHIMFSAPIAWNGDVFDDGIVFHQSGSTVPLLKMHHASLQQLPDGTPLIVGGQRAVLTTSGSGQVVYVQDNLSILTFELDKSLSSPQGMEPAQSVVRLLKSVVFTDQTSSTGSGTVQVTASGSVDMSGTPCGGPAGILCPSGSYCAVTDTAHGIGVCRTFTAQ